MHVTFLPKRASKIISLEQLLKTRLSSGSLVQRYVTNSDSIDFSRNSYVSERVRNIEVCVSKYVSSYVRLTLFSNSGKLVFVFHVGYEARVPHGAEIVYSNEVDRV